MLVVREGRALSGGAAGDEAVRAALDQIVDETPERPVVYLTVLERRDVRNEDALEVDL